MIHFHLANRVATCLATCVANRSRAARASLARLDTVRPGVALCALTASGLMFGPILSGVSQAKARGAATPSKATPSKATPSKAAQTLSFQVAARFDARQNGSSMGQPQQSLDARVWASGSRVRLETSLSDQPVVLLYTAPYIYKLLPATKAGVRYRTSSRDASSGVPNEFDLQKFLSNPTLIRSTLQKNGARRGASASLNGTVADIYTASNFMGRGQNVKVWLRRGDALPLRLEARSNTLFSVISWRDYKRGAPLSNTLFTRPAGYKIRDSQSRPRLF